MALITAPELQTLGILKQPPQPSHQIIILTILRCFEHRYPNNVDTKYLYWQYRVISIITIQILYNNTLNILITFNKKSFAIYYYFILADTL